jgi:Putative redox-active protein (C_GCAxxG_C_C)
MRAVCPLEGGALSMGSTCGVVSGGCLGLALFHVGELASGDTEKRAALYERLLGYTRWFESEYGSTICRERSGVDLTTFQGLIDYLFTGKFATRCAAHAGPAAEHLVELASKPLESGSGRAGQGLCAALVIKGIREDTGYGNDLVEKVSIALDGGIGLSGGLCGALAGALMVIGSIWGIDPRESLLRGTLVPFTTGHINMYRRRRRPELWSMGGPVARHFVKEFGSMECRAITGRTFESYDELADHVSGSETCAKIKDWCRVHATSGSGHFDAFSIELE